MRYLIALFFIWIPVAEAVDVAIPELGVVLNGYPDEQFRPRPVEVPDGYVIAVRFRGTLLIINRFADPARAAKPVSERSYQKQIRREAEDSGQKVSDEELIKIGGQDAWLITTTQQIPNSIFVFFKSVVTVVVDHQLVRFSVSHNEKSTMSENFQSVLNLVKSVTFEPVDRSAVPVLTLAKDAPAKMPHFVADVTEPLYYPGNARYFGVQGAVDVLFTIDGQGQAQNIKITHADHIELMEPIIQYLPRGRFHVPDDWVESGSETMPFAFEYHFWLPSKPGDICTHGDTPARLDGAVVVRVCSPWGLDH